MRAEPDAEAVPVTIGDMTTTRVAVRAGPDGQDHWIPGPGPLAGWDRAPFTSVSHGQVTVLEKLP